MAAFQKTCYDCGKKKPYRDFHLNSNGSVRSDCKDCRRAVDRTRRAKWKAASDLQDLKAELPDDVDSDAIESAIDVLEECEEPEDELPGDEVAALAATIRRITGKPVIPGSTPVPENQFYKGVTGKKIQYKAGAKVWTICVLSDVHVPEHDKLVWGVVLEWIRDNQPNEIILNGDFLELSSCSMHGGSPSITSLESDFSAGRAAIQELRTAAPDAKITLAEGNHETRLPRFLLAKAPSLFGSLTIASGLHLDKFGVEFVGEREQPISRGTIDILHGHQVGGGKQAFLPKHHAAKVVDIYGKTGRTVVIGHSHREGVHSKPGTEGVQRGVALGCLRTMDPEWMHGHLGGWTHQFGVGYVWPGGPSHFYQITVNDGQFIWNGKLYKAKTAP